MLTRVAVVPTYKWLHQSVVGNCRPVSLQANGARYSRVPKGSLGNEWVVGFMRVSMVLEQRTHAKVK